MEKKIIQLKDGNGDSLFPKSIFKAIIRDDGKYNLTQELAKIEDLMPIEVMEDGLYIVDKSLNICFSYNSDGLNVLSLSSNFYDLIYYFLQTVGLNSNGVNISSILTWTFVKSGSNSKETVTVPHTCNVTDGLSDSMFRGLTTYSSTYNVKQSECNIGLFFGAVAQYCNVYINGILVGNHFGGYTPFYFDVTRQSKIGENTIKIECNNSLSVENIPVTADFNIINGILRPIYLIKSRNISLDNSQYGRNKFHLFYDIDTKSAYIKFKINNYLASESVIKVKFEQTLIDDGNLTETKELFNGQMSIASKAYKDVAVTLNGMDFSKLWDGLDNPNLYKFSLSIYYHDEKIEESSANIGLRKFEIKEDGFYLNNRLYPLRGVALHEDAPSGAFVWNEEEKKLLEQHLKYLGVTFVKTAHYPQSSFITDLCDKLGIIAHGEIPWINNCGDNAPDSYGEHIINNFKELLLNYYNTTCIAFFSMSNELCGDYASIQGNFNFEKAKGIMNSMYDYAKSYDNRLILGYNTRSTQVYDFKKWDYISFSVFSGWYDSAIGAFNHFTNFTTGKRSSFKLIGVDQYGGGCNPDCHSDTPLTTTNIGSGNARHDNEYINIMYESLLPQIMSKDWLIYCSNWILYDFAVAARREGYIETNDGVTLRTNTAKYCLNDKGIATRERKPKDVFYLMAAYFNKAQKNPVCHICSKTFNIRPLSYSLKVYTNEDSLKIILNDVLLTTLSVTDKVAIYDITLSEGTNTIVVESTNGIKDSVTITGILN